MVDFFDPRSVLLMLMMIGGAGVRDLVSCVSTEAYWKAKGVEVSIDQLGRNLDPIKPVDISRLVADLDADDARDREAATAKIAAVGAAALPALEKAMKAGSPEVIARARVLAAKIGAVSKASAIRRLMAIRTLGEMQDPKGLDLLQPLLSSGEMFEAEYAKAAIARIQGKAYLTPAATEAMRMTEIGLLPAKIDTIMQASPEIESNFSLEKAIDRLPLDDNRKSRLKDEATGKILTLLDTVGNIRLDVLTWGFNPAPPMKPGNGILIARGQFDATALCDFLGKLIPKSKTVEGSNVFEINSDTVLIVSSDRRLVFLSRETDGDLSLEPMADALKKGVGTFPDNAELAKLVKSVDVKTPLWAAGRISPGLAEIVGPFADFDSAILVGTQHLDEKKNLVTNLTMQATGTDAARTKKAAEDTRKYIKFLVADGRRQEPVFPFLKSEDDFLQNVKIESDGQKATLTGSLENLTLLPRASSAERPAVQWLLR